MNLSALVFLIFIPAVVKSEKDLKRLGIVILITCFVSSLFGILQYIGGFVVIPPYAIYDIYEPEGSFVRVFGLSESAVQLGFNLPMILLPLIGLYFIRGINSHSRKIIILIAIVISIALYLTFTRSGLYSLVPGAIFLLFSLKGKARRSLFLLVLCAIVVGLVFLGISTNRYSQGFGDDSSSTGRLVLWQAGVQIALDNPITGIGWARFRDVSTQYAAFINTDLMEHESGAGEALGRYEAHNDFIHIWAAFGSLALISFIWIFIGIFKNFFIAYRRLRTRFLRGFTIGCFGAVAAYIVNAFTHNVMDTSMLLWIIGGLSIACIKLVMNDKYPKKVETE